MYFDHHSNLMKFKKQKSKVSMNLFENLNEKEIF